MGHEIESIAWYGERPWHGLGTGVAHCMTSEEAIVAAGLNWEVEKQNLFVKQRQAVVTIPDGEAVTSEEAAKVAGDIIVEVPDFFAVVRKTDNKPLGVVGSRYTPLQNKDAFAFFDELVGVKEAIYETAGSLRGGKIIWIMCKLPGQIGWAEDPIEQWLVLSNAHDGSRQLFLMISPIRVVCMNTLNVAIQSATESIEIRHTSGILDRVVDAREALGIIQEYFQDMDGMLKKLKGRTLNEAQIKSYVYSLFPFKVKTDGSLPGIEGALDIEFGARMKAYVEKVLELVETGKGTDISGVKGTAYGVLNAAVEFADHWKPVKGKNNDVLVRKLDSLWFGSAARFKQKAFDHIMDVVSDQPTPADETENH